LDFDNPVFPSYSMPYALIRDRFASAIVRSDPAGWNMPENLTGSPVSTPNGTMSSISKSIMLPMRTLCRRPSSLTSIGGAFNPQHLSDQWAKPGHRPTQLPAKDLYQLVELRIRGSVVDKTPTRQFPSVITLGGIGDKRDRAAADVGAFDCSLTNVETRVTRQ
jgi:hypothetical protein